MNENAKRWVKTLKNTHVKQGRSRLGGPEGYCCLGVGCLVYEKETGEKLPRNDDGNFYGGSLDGDYYVVANWLGLSHCYGSFSDEKGNSATLTDLNDIKEFTFSEIASVIENEPNGLFID